MSGPLEGLTALPALGAGDPPGALHANAAHPRWAGRRARGPYRWVRHRGYLGSLLCLNGVALASGNGVALAASLLATLAAYLYRIRAEDAMLVAAFGATYEVYRREVGALIPFLRPG
jgi:hypothetical protein